LDFRCSMEFGVDAVAGKRNYMEDRYSSQLIQVETENGKETLGLFAVYDGHGGEFAVSRVILFPLEASSSRLIIVRNTFQKL